MALKEHGYSHVAFSSLEACRVARSRVSHFLFSVFPLSFPQPFLLSVTNTISVNRDRGRRRRQKTVHARMINPLSSWPQDSCWEGFGRVSRDTVQSTSQFYQGLEENNQKQLTPPTPFPHPPPSYLVVGHGSLGVYDGLAEPAHRRTVSPVRRAFENDTKRAKDKEAEQHGGREGGREGKREGGKEGRRTAVAAARNQTG